MIFKFFIFISFNLLISLSCCAQNSTELSLNQALVDVETMNIEVLMSNLDKQYQERVVKLSKNSHLPRVDFSSSQSLLFGRFIDPFTNTFSLGQLFTNSISLNASISIYEGNSKKHTAHLNKSELEISKNKITIQTNDFKKLLVKNFMEYSLIFNIKNLLDEEISNLILEIERFEKNKQSGRTTDLDVLKLNSMLSERKYLKQSYLNKSEIHKLNILLLTGRSLTDSSITIQPDRSISINSTDSISVVQNKQINIDNNPEWQLQNNMMEKELTGIKLRKSVLKPRINLSTSIYTGYSANSVQANGATSFDSFIEQNKDNLNESIQLSVSVPIFSKFEKQRLNYLENIVNHKTQLSQDRVRRSIELEYKTKLVDLRQAEFEYQNAKIDLSEKSKIVSITKERFEKGHSTSNEYFQAKQGYLASKISFFQSYYNWSIENLKLNIDYQFLN